MSTIKYDTAIAVLEVDCAHSTWFVFACQSSLLALRARYSYNDFNVYCRESAPGTVSLTGDRAEGDDSNQCAYRNP